MAKAINKKKKDDNIIFGNVPIGISTMSIGITLGRKLYSIELPQCEVLCAQERYHYHRDCHTE